MRLTGIEPVSVEWQSTIIPLNQKRCLFIFSKL